MPTTMPIDRRHDWHSCSQPGLAAPEQTRNRGHWLAIGWRGRRSCRRQRSRFGLGFVIRHRTAPCPRPASAGRSTGISLPRSKRVGNRELPNRGAAGDRASMPMMRHARRRSGAPGGDTWGGPMTLRNIALAGTLGRGAAELAGLAEAPEIGRHDRRHRMRHDAEPFEVAALDLHRIRHHVVVT